MASPQTSALSDPARLGTLRASGLLDSEPEEAFDRYTRLAARLLDVPVAFVSLVTADRQFFKSEVGLPPALREPRETPLSLSLCKYAVERREPLRLGDLRENSVPEARAVLDETGLGSFLGAPLITGDGTCLGSLSVMDEEPREWTDEDEELLGDLAAAVSTQIDVRLQATERDVALRTSRRRLEALSEGVTIHDADGMMVYANRAAEEILGLERSEMTTRAYDAPDWSIRTLDGEPMAPEDLPAARAIEDGVSVRDVKMVVDRPDDRPVVLSVNAVPVHDDEGDVREAIISFRDVTEQVRARHEAEQAERKWSSVVELAPVGIVLTDPGQGRVLAVNQEIADFLGYEREELLGMTVGELDHWEDTDQLREIRRTVEETAAIRSELAPIRDRDGELRYGRLSIRVLELDGEERWLQIVQDVTDQVRAERRLQESEERHRRIFEHNVAGIYRSRPGGEILDCNPAFAEMFGYGSPEEVVGTSGDEFFFWTEQRREANRELADVGEMGSREFRLRRRDGEPIWVLAHSVMIEDDETGEPVIYGTMVDITERREAQQRHRRLFEQGVAAIFRSEHDPPARIIECNRAFADLFGFESPEEAVGISAYELYPSDEVRDGAMEEIREGGRKFTEAFEMRRRDGSPVWVMGETRLVDDPQLGIVNEGLMFDVSDRVRAQQQLRHQALHDPLTDLANRTLLEDRVDQGLARSRRRDEPLGLLMIDVAHFKRINDRLGHAAGDRVLTTLARRLQDVLREEDTVARWGGDEFVVVLPELDGVEAVEAIRERILDAVHRPIEAGGESLRIDLSVGAVVHGDSGHPHSVETEDPEELVRFGDLALHRAKERPAGRFYLFDPEEEVQGVAQIRLEQDLREAVGKEEIVPYFQPMVRLEDGSPVGAEVLARWRHPERGLVPPAEFIPVAEELGLIGELGESVLRQGTEWAAGLPDGALGPSGPSVSFNLSAQQFEDPDLVSTVSDLLSAAGLEPERVIVEVTETSVMEAPAQIGELQALGLHVHIDDFGTGYSTFAYLRDLELSGLKVDRDFVRDVASNESDAALVETVLTLGRKMDLTVVAEGIETEEQRRRLAELGCEVGQGFLFARPMPAAECEAWLRER